MADELTLADSFAYDDNGVEKSYSQSGEIVDVAGTTHVDIVLSVATSDTTIDLGTLTAPLGWAHFENLDPTNYIELKIAAAGTIIAKLLPGEVARFRIGSGITAPVAIANSGACLMHYVILPP